ncbi:MAG: glycosyltransferase family 2 protein [Candidatus Mariimomonas ferrooxydans]
MGTVPLISAIIVNFNGRHLLKACLESLYNQSFRDMEIIVVDNASEDGSVQYVKDLFSDVRVISLSENLGYASAGNEGLRRSNGRYIALLNNDVELDRHWLENLFVAMEANPEAGIGASKILVYGANMIDSAGDGYATSLKGFKRGEGKSAEEYNIQEYIFGACAGAALYRRTMLDKIGFMDDDFFLIHEDTDLNFRAQLYGWRVLYVPKSIVHHKVRSSIGNMSDTAVYYTLRNSEIVRIKNVSPGVFFRCLPAFILGIITEFYYFALKHGRFRLYFKAKVDAVKLLPKMLKRRSDIIHNAKVDNKRLYSVMTSVWNKEFFSMKVKKFLYG